MDRRTFLLSGALAGAGLVAAACSRRGPGPAGDLSVFVGGMDFAAGADSYLALGVRDAAGDPVARDVSVSLRSGARTLPPRRATWFPYSHAEHGGPSGVHAMVIRFPEPGVWDVDVDAGGAKGTAALKVSATALAPTVGDPAPSTRTPTGSDARGVDPICTRKPACPLHDVSLDAALAGGRPVAFFIGSPAFCTSRTCGPNLDELLLVRDELGARAAFVHAEVYVDDHPDSIRRRKLTRAMTEWRIPSEPWLFLVARDGRIARRFEGPVTAPQIADALRTLV